MMNNILPTIQFTFDGITGIVDEFGFVFWGGMAFDKSEIVTPEFRAIVDNAHAQMYSVV